MKKGFVLCVLGIMAVCMSGCSEKNKVKETVSDEAFIDVGEEAPLEKITVRVGVYSDVNAIGTVWLMEQSKTGNTTNEYDINIVDSVDKLEKDMKEHNIDAAAVPCNIAAKIYNDMEQNVYIAAVNSVSSYGIISSDDSITDISKIRGKNIYVPGENTNAGYILGYILKNKKINPDIDVTMVYKKGYKELMNALKTEDDMTAILAQPYQDIAMRENEGFKVISDVNEQLYEINEEIEAIEGVLIVSRDFANDNLPSFESLLDEYSESVDSVSTNGEKVTELIKKYDVLGNDILTDNLLNCNIAYMDGNVMIDKVKLYLNMLYEYDSDSIGGAIPEDDFYYVRSNG